MWARPYVVLSVRILSVLIVLICVLVNLAVIISATFSNVFIEFSFFVLSVVVSLGDGDSGLMDCDFGISEHVFIS